MISISEKYNCTGCRACAAICPKSCIKMESDAEGFDYPKVSMELCTNCGLCEMICPILHKVPKKNIPTAYAAINRSDQIREQSSSGGIFYLLAQYVISNGGVVFGARFDDHFKVIHDYAQTLEEAKLFMGSKYTQSDIGDNYIRVREFLMAGKLVLFTGTPCQIGALKSFLRKDYENLICQDFICHGVPSPMVWQKYMDFNESKSTSKIQKVFFRSKKYGWKQFSLMLEFSDGNRFEERYTTDLFMQCFLRDLCLRPSCYHCQFKSTSRDADITLADFWGIQNVNPRMDDNKGTSLVIIHSSKGEKLFDIIREDIKYEQTALEQAIQFNPSMTTSVSNKPQRNMFFSEMQRRPFDKVAKKYCKKRKSLIKVLKNYYRQTKKLVIRIKRRIKAFCNKEQ